MKTKSSDPIIHLACHTQSFEIIKILSRMQIKVLTLSPLDSQKYGQRSINSGMLFGEWIYIFVSIFLGG
jgi:hypothetical protein